MVLGWLVGQAIREISIAADPVVISVKREKYEGFDIFGLYVKGSFKIPWFKGGLVYLVNLYELDSNEKELPVICQVKGLNSNGVFQWISDSINSETGAYQVKTPTKILNIPIDALMFSKKGELRLRFELKMVTFDNSSQPSVIKEAFAIESFYNNKTGYQDMVENSRIFTTNAVELGNILVNIDGEASKSEIKVLTNWIKKNVKNEEKQDQLIENVKAYSKQGYSIENLRSYAKNAISEINDVADASDKIALLQLLHDISIADGERGEAEHQVIKAVINKLGIDYDKYSQIFSKSVNLDGAASDSELEALVGIQSSMSLQEKIAQLKKAFKEWNSKITSPNQIEAANAKRVLDFISKKRNQLENA